MMVSHLRYALVIRLGRFGNNQTMKHDKPNIVVDSGCHDKFSLSA
jgi:hypothetical protein